MNRRSGQTILDVANVLSRPLRADTAARVAGAGATADGLGFLVAPDQSATCPPFASRTRTGSFMQDKTRLYTESAQRLGLIEQPIRIAKES